MPTNLEAHWRERADMARLICESMHTATLKRLMLDLADQYDRLANDATLLRGQTHPKRRSGGGWVGIGKRI